MAEDLSHAQDLELYLPVGRRGEEHREIRYKDEVVPYWNFARRKKPETEEY